MEIRQLLGHSGGFEPPRPPSHHYSRDGGGEAVDGGLGGCPPLTISLTLEQQAGHSTNKPSKSSLPASQPTSKPTRNPQHSDLKPSALNPQPPALSTYTLKPQPSTLNLQPSALSLQPSNPQPPNPQHSTLKLQTLSHQPSHPIPQHSTFNPQP